MIPEMEVISNRFIAKRINVRDVNEERLHSFREGVIDFCRRSKSLGKPMHTWSYISRILQGKELADLWWSFDGNIVNGFSIIRVYQDFDGQWTAYIQFGWSNSGYAKDHIRTILDDYKEKGVERIQFVTLRNPKVFERWLEGAMRPVGTLFEVRR